MAVYALDGTEIDYVYDVDGTELEDVYDLEGNRIGMEHNYREFLQSATVSNVGNVEVSGTKQGACTDGEYIYQAVGDSSGYTYMNILKYKISDGTVETANFEGTPNFGHANDMIYNPVTGYLYVCTMLSTGAVVILDASDLSYVTTITVLDENGDPYAVWQACYDRTNDCYYSTHSGYVYVYDSSWEYVRKYALYGTPEGTQQGCETDGEYYYRCIYSPNSIDVTSLTGHYVATVSMSSISGEPESIMYDWNGNFYVSKNASRLYLFKVGLYADEA